MDTFTKELNKLLDKHPELGAFTIHVRPRLTIVPGSVPQPLVVPKEAIKPEAAQVVSEPGPVREMPKMALESVLAMESTVKARVAGLKKATPE